MKTIHPPHNLSVRFLIVFLLLAITGHRVVFAGPTLSRGQTETLVATVLSPYDMLRLQTLGSATVMRVADKIGSLEPGKFADFDVIDPRHRDIGPVYDPYASVVLACGQANLERVYIGGELVVLRGEILGRNFDHVADEVRRRAEAVRQKVDQAKHP